MSSRIFPWDGCQSLTGCCPSKNQEISIIIMDHLQLSKCDPRGFKDSRIQGFEWNALKTIEGSKGSRVQGFKWKAKKCSKKETQILLAGDLDLIVKKWIGYTKKDIAEIERMLKALIKSLDNKPLNPGPLESLDPLLQLNWRRTLFISLSYKKFHLKGVFVLCSLTYFFEESPTKLFIFAYHVNLFTITPLKSWQNRPKGPIIRIRKGDI